MHFQFITLLLLQSLSSSAHSSEFSSEFSILALLIITLQIVIIVISQISRRKHKRGRLYLQITQKELEQRIEERTQKLENSNSRLTQVINEHESTEVLLTETQEYLNSIINSMPSILIGVTENGRITHWNDAAFRATQISAENAQGQPLLEVFPSIPVSLDAINATISQGIPRLTENLQQGSGPQSKHLDLTIYPLLAARKPGAVIRLDDVTQRVRIENMMIQNEKMMSLGELAAGMAHEINNPLSAIVNSTQNIQRRTSHELAKNHSVAEDLGTSVDKIQQYLEQRDVFTFLDSVREAGDRAAKIVSNMLEFSRASSRDHQQVDLKSLLEHALELASNSFELKTADGQTSVTLIREYEADLPLIECSPTEIQQVVLNLLRNACQCFLTRENTPSREPEVTLRLYRWDDNICMEIADNGPGMSDEVSRHIFEPFFTTKDVGQGTGLGLSVTYFIVTEHHHGSIEVESNQGLGTNFIVTLPLPPLLAARG